MSTTASRDTLAIVLAHGKIAEACRRHEPVWRRHCGDLFYFTPVDDPLPAGFRQYSVGKSGSYVPDTSLRCREALRFATLTGYKYVLLIEWDSLIFADIPTKLLPFAGGVSAPLFTESEPGKKFKGKFYLHFPQLFTRSGAKAVVAAMDGMPLESEFGFTDRYVGYAVEQSGIPVLDLNPTGFACTHNEIDAAKLPEVLKQYAAGARWSHGIKSKETFQALAAASFE